jgi:hypothetical protein
MSKKKKAHDVIAGFHAVAASRRWRRQTSALLNKMTSAQQIEFLNRGTEGRTPASGAKPARSLAHR